MTPWIWFAVVPLTAAAAWGVHWGVQQFIAAWQQSDSGLFCELCRAHKLTRRERRFLWRLAHDRQISPPARIFLEPDRFSPADPLSKRLFSASR